MWQSHPAVRVDVYHPLVPQLLRSSSAIETVFDLIGQSEPHMTDALGWAITELPELLERLVWRALDDKDAKVDPSSVMVNLQRRVESGRTDIEILQAGAYHIILEAKKGWTIPREIQLRLYERDLLANKQAPLQRLALLTDATQAYARASGFDPSLFQVPLSHLTWADVLHDLSSLRLQSPWKRRIAGDLASYLGTVVHDRRVDSNIVFVLSLSDDSPEWLGMSFVDVVTKQARYFHVYGQGPWPKEAPNYLGFRYHGRLQSIHHVESRDIHLGLQGQIPGIKANPPGEDGYSYAVYKLGPTIRPDHIVRSGNLRNRWTKCMLDTLLTCDSVVEAEALTNERMAGPEGLAE